MVTEKYKLQHRVDTLKNWNSNNPILLKGEIGFVDSSNEYRIGDGKSPWTQLISNYAWDGNTIKGDKGDQGNPGQDGHTPNIVVGSNGHWFIDNIDTGTTARGEKGEVGPVGPSGVSLGEIALSQALDTSIGSENKVLSLKTTSEKIEEISAKLNGKLNKIEINADGQWIIPIKGFKKNTEYTLSIKSLNDYISGSTVTFEAIFWYADITTTWEKIRGDLIINNQDSVIKFTPKDNYSRISVSIDDQSLTNGAFILTEQVKATVVQTESFQEDLKKINNDIIQNKVIFLDLEKPLPEGDFYTINNFSQAIPEESYKLGMIVTFKLSQFKQILCQFIGNDLSSRYQRSSWMIIEKELSKLNFLEGYIEILPKDKDNSGNYIINRNWQVKILKNVNTSTVYKRTDRMNTTSTINISEGIYDLFIPELTSDIYSVPLFWNQDNNRFELGIVSMASFLVGTYTSCRNYELFELTNISGIVSIFTYKGGSLLMGENHANIDVLNVKNVIPSDFTNFDIYNLLIFYKKSGISKYYFPQGEYKFSKFIVDVANQQLEFFGDNDKTILKGWDFIKNKSTLIAPISNYKNLYIHDINLNNIMFKTASMDSVCKGGNVIFDNVTFYYEHTSTTTGYAFNLSHGFIRLVIKNCNFQIKEGESMAWAINIDEQNSVLIEHVTIGPGFGRNITFSNCSDFIIRYVHTSAGTTGISFASDKNHPVENALIEHCVIENAVEESISADCIGNDVALQPCIAELYITNGELIRYNAKYGEGKYYNSKLKIYCKSRELIGSHQQYPDGENPERYQEYSFIGKEEYIKKFYVIFHDLSGKDFAGQVCKIFDVGHDSKGEFLIISTDTPYELLNKEYNNTDFEKWDDGNAYKVASIMSGFFNCSIKNNVIRNAKKSGISLFNGFHLGEISNNSIENCKGYSINWEQGSSYLSSSTMLAHNVKSPSNGNIIINNRFNGGEYYAFAFTKNGSTSVKGHYNIFEGNIINGSLGIFIDNEDNMIFDSNIINGINAKVVLSNTVNTENFGITFPTAPYPGQLFFDMNTNTKKFWNGSVWK